MKLKKKIKGSASFILLILIVFSLCVFLLMEFMKMADTQMQLDGKRYQLHFQRKIILSMFKYKIKTIVPRFIIEYIEKYNTIPCETVIHNYITDYLISNKYMYNMKIVVDLIIVDESPPAYISSEAIKTATALMQIESAQLRITLIQGQKIICQYNLPLKGSTAQYSKKYNVLT
jgi:hypothetical protein